MKILSLKIRKKILFVLLGTLPFTAEIQAVQISEAGRIDTSGLITAFNESMTENEGIRFNRLFFSESVDFTRILSKKSEWSIKKDITDSQRIATSSHKKLNNDICKTPKRQEENFTTSYFFGGSNMGYFL